MSTDLSFYIHSWPIPFLFSISSTRIPISISLGQQRPGTILVLVSSTRKLFLQNINLKTGLYQVSIYVSFHPSIYLRILLSYSYLVVYLSSKEVCIFSFLAKNIKEVLVRTTDINKSDCTAHIPTYEIFGVNGQHLIHYPLQ